MKNILFTLLLGFFALSCSSDDDICTSGEATPRMKIKFKNSVTGNIKTLDSLYLDADFGNGPVNLVRQKLADSVLLPLRVDDVPYTDFYVRLTRKGAASAIRVNYSTKSEYVSPACGIRKLYDSFDPVLTTPNPVVSLEKNQTSILDENKTHLYLHF